MYYWNSQTIAADLRKLPNIQDVKIYGPGGNYDTQNIVVSVEGSDEEFFISGYLSTEECQENPEDTEVIWVALSDGLDSRGGLNTHCPTASLVYIKIRQYFIDHGATVINHYRDIF